ENEFGYAWHVAPQEQQVAPGAYSILVFHGAMGCTFAVGQQGELLINLALAKPKGPPGDVFRPVAFDAERMRLSLCQTVAGGGHKLGTALNMALWCSNAGVAQKVRYFGVEVLTPGGRKAIAAKARKRANEAGLEVLPAAQIGEVYDFAFTSME